MKTKPGECVFALDIHGHDNLIRGFVDMGEGQIAITVMNKRVHASAKSTPAKAECVTSMAEIINLAAECFTDSPNMRDPKARIKLGGAILFFAKSLGLVQALEAENAKAE